MEKGITIHYQPQLPIHPRPIAIIGAGGIVGGAHLPAYQKAGWQVVAICDPMIEKAQQLADTFHISQVYDNVAQLVAQALEEVIFDIAVPASVLPGILEQLPPRAVVLMQKPMGEDIAGADRILQLCREKEFTAAVNFQMRFIPAVMAAKDMINQGLIGTLHDMEIRMNIYHPWHLWEFLFGIPRMEMLYHSIHYMDLLRYFLGEPKSVYAKTVKHPKMMQLASTRSVIMLEYDEAVRAFINTNHGHEFGLKYQDSFIKWEGTKGAIRTTLGLNIDYPHGVPDTFEYVLLDGNKTPEWQSVQLEGTWMPDAFGASMANLMCYAEGSAPVLINHINSAYKTMQVVEAAYASSDAGGTLVG
ncbi:MAG: Gfo/Idh/MocA family oxidoreductase [Chitinophaga sp.]|uniref:Gfo/Idh/MocA family protein n=1 Tax=Chitinophaga sp. TaxID=1869181 RepID=UPI001B1D7143|nr:Gfo/Idh/MocA family oxidoreductase [Chitinophaga sp.]MBO9732677.1 Gfo/Idh/MocA family oxidoreductase [Chitinophaga sp.]